MTVGLLTEKSSAAKHFSTALGGMNGTYNGEPYVIVHARGHLYEFIDPHKMVDPALEDKYRKWDLGNLPWDPNDMSWELGPIKDTAQVRNEIRSKLASCDEIVIATDVDPTGEGGMIAVNAFVELNLRPKKWSRMYFTDETEKSLQKAFAARKTIPVLTEHDEFKMASYRSRFDLLSMQFTRLATAQARASGKDFVLRQGRLKSAMVRLVGDQLEAYTSYVKKPFFQNRFRDENGVTYTNPEESRFDQKAQAPQQYSPSPVVRDSATAKRTPPPRLLDLATLSARLVGHGIKAKATLPTYQQMYEAQVVSYPRTEDKTITPEQFQELSPLADRIAAVVGVDTALLTHRQPRATHVKLQGAHGANRPGPKVPASLDAVEAQFGKAGRLIYQTLALNYLAILAEDYRYEQQKGHVEAYPAFVGTANVPQHPGWKAVFDPDAEDQQAGRGARPDQGAKTPSLRGKRARDDEGPVENSGEGDGPTENSTGLGTRAEPFVFEGANKRPAHPSMKWLMAQLEKRDVGTGATRTSTYAEVTNAQAKWPLLVEKGTKLSLAEAGELSWRLLPGTHIGDLGLTEKVYADMRRIAAGEATAEDCLAEIAQLVRDDLAAMTTNATTMRSALGLSHTPIVQVARATGVWQTAPDGPTPVTFKRVWSGHEFTDAEVADLLAGKSITISAVSAKTQRPFQATGKLDLGTYQGKRYVGFTMDAPVRPAKPTPWSGHTFTPGEITTLLAGDTLEIDDFVSAKTGRTFGCRVSWDAAARKIVPDFGTSTSAGTGKNSGAPGEPPRSWCGVTFTAAQRKALAAGKPITGKGFTSKAGKTFDATLTWTDGDGSGRKKIVPEFARR